MEPSFFTFSDGICAWNMETFHLDAIISVSRVSLISYLPKYSIGPFEGAKMGLCFLGEFSGLQWTDF